MTRPPLMPPKSPILPMSQATEIAVAASTATREPIKIGINTSCVVAGGGITHLRNLIPRLVPLLERDELFLIGGREAKERIGLGVDVRWIDPGREPSGLFDRIVWENTKLAAILDREQADVLLHPANFGPLRSPVPIVTVVHNLAPFLASVKSGESVAQKIRLELLRRLTWRSLGRSDTTIFLSEWGRQLVLDDYGQSPERSPVVPFGSEHLGANVDHGAAERLGLEKERFFLSVSHLYRYKKIELLIDACASLKGSESDLPLVIAGAPYDATYTASLRQRALDRGVDARFVGSLPADAVAGLMSSCLALLFSSEAENLPLTLLEAMSLGCAIVTNRCCSMPEVCTDAVLYVEQRTSTDYADSMRRLVESASLRDDLRRRGRARAADYSWDVAAKETLAVLRAAGGRAHAAISARAGEA